MYKCFICEKLVEEYVVIHDEKLCLYCKNEYTMVMNDIDKIQMHLDYRFKTNK